MPSSKQPDNGNVPNSLPPLAPTTTAGGLNAANSKSSAALNVVQNLHEIDTKDFLANQIRNDMNKFKNADAFVNAGRERVHALMAGG